MYVAPESKVLMALAVAAGASPVEEETTKGTVLPPVTFPEE